MPKVLPEQLRIGGETLRYIAEIEPQAAWTFNEHYWTLHLCVTLKRTSAEVPLETNWYLKVSDDYPNGSIHFYPARDGGIRHTFPHQEFNGEIGPRIPFLSGSPCLTYPGAALGKLSLMRAPSDYYSRLHWFGERLVDWLEAAIDGTLTNPGDHFEFPALPTLTTHIILMVR